MLQASPETKVERFKEKKGIQTQSLIVYLSKWFTYIEVSYKLLSMDFQRKQGKKLTESD